MSVKNQVNRKSALAPITETEKEYISLEKEIYSEDHPSTAKVKDERKGDATRILIVDDNRFNILAIQNMLE